MTKHEAAALLRQQIQSAIKDAQWNGLTLEQINDICVGRPHE
jgi:hypothetical protein